MACNARFPNILGSIFRRNLIFENRHASMSCFACAQPLMSQKSSLFCQILNPVVPEIQQVRTNIRKFFPRPSERKRIARHGYETRLKTAGGRAILMRRILKGRFVLSH